MTTKQIPIPSSSRNNKKQRVTLFLDSGLLTHARVQAVVEGLSLTFLVEKALVGYLPKETVIKKDVVRIVPDP